MKNLLIIFFVLGITISCTKNEKFDSSKWKDKYQEEEYRETVLQDLIKGNYLINKPKKKIIEILGNPDFQSNDSENKLIYTIKIKWNNGCFPVPLYSKSLIILLNDKQVFKDYKIEEWED